MEQELIKRTTLVEMVTTWNAAQENIKKAFDLLTETKERLTAVFGDYTFESRHLDSLDAERTIADCHRRAWKEIVQKTEMRRLLSIKRAKELDEHLDEDELPPITEEEIIKMLKSVLTKATAGHCTAEKEVHHEDQHQCSIAAMGDTPGRSALSHIGGTEDIR